MKMLKDFTSITTNTSRWKKWETCDISLEVTPMKVGSYNEYSAKYQFVKTAYELVDNTIQPARQISKLIRSH